MRQIASLGLKVDAQKVSLILHGVCVKKGMAGFMGGTFLP